MTTAVEPIEQDMPWRSGHLFVPQSIMQGFRRVGFCFMSVIKARPEE